MKAVEATPPTQLPAESTPEMPKPQPAPAAGRPNTSPIRPTPPEPQPAPLPIAPNMQADAVEMPVSGTFNVEERLKAELTLEKLRQKTALVAQEFAAGKLNRAQFLAMYQHYNEKRIIIERLLERDPDSQAWESVASAGNTTFLREHFASRVVSFAIFDYDSSDPLIERGAPTLPKDFSDRLLSAIRKLRRSQKPLTVQRKVLEDGHWMAFIPGLWTTAFVMFTLEPSNRQLVRVADLHRDFERANKVLLSRGVRNVDQLVFPHRALLEESA
ncbi:MAG: hypothetical protein OHK0023_19100 [Anaerolineae bacterium]